ncbi:uncharacterized protein LOC134726422 [Mytilus trossulus]|uniref:uncharacterized protein LOC134726422 n=1 Tax=Mytilus trossulus TaxID=6551 RepID=UPI003004AB20
MINDDLVDEINQLGLGIKIGESKLSLPLYSDDIVLMAENECDMQKMLDKLHDWCKKWRVLINTDKSKVVHFRASRKKRSEFQFRIGGNILQIIDKYKYLGVILNEKKDYTSNAENLSAAGGRALGAIISKIHSLKEFGIKTYEKLYVSCIVPILDYCSSVWGFKDLNCIDTIQNKAIRYFLGVHKFAPKLAINGDFGWLPSKERRWCNMDRMVRYWNRLMDMDNSRRCKRVFLWDYELSTNNWSSSVRTIMSLVSMDDNFQQMLKCDVILAFAITKTLVLKR